MPSRTKPGLPWPSCAPGSAASPATCAAATLVPRLCATGWWARHSGRGVVAEGVVVHGSQTFVKSGRVPPGAATLMAERPKALYGAGASTFSHGPSAPAELVGPVAAAPIALAGSHGSRTRSPL